MSESTESLTMQSHISQRSMDWHYAVTGYRRYFEDAVLKQDLSLLPTAKGQEIPTSDFLSDWFLSVTEESLMTAKFHMVSIISSCTDLAVTQGLPRALAHGIKDDFFAALAREKQPAALVQLTNQYVEKLVKELRTLCRQRYSHMVLNATTFIYQNLYQNIHPHDVADFLQKDRTYLAKKFREETGLTLSEYIRRAKIDRARHLISQHLYSLTEISELLGYPSYAQFHRNFKKVTGAAPGEFS